MTHINATVVTQTIIRFETILSQFQNRLDNLEQLYYTLTSKNKSASPQSVETAGPVALNDDATTAQPQTETTAPTTENI